MKKTLVLYVFHEYNIRVDIFLNNALFEDDNVDFIIIYNNLNLELEMKSKFTNTYKNVKIIVRDNVGIDFGGWSHALLTDELYKNYDYFIFANSSIIGPYMELNQDKKWTDIFTNNIDNDVRLFGCTINTLNDPINRSHVQSYLFSMNKETLEFLIDCEIFSLTNMPKSMGEAIWNREVPMSRKIIEKGWNIGCTCKKLDGIDYTFKKVSLENLGFDIHTYVTSNEYYNNNFWTPNEVIFIKGNKFPIKEEHLNIFKYSS